MVHNIIIFNCGGQEAALPPHLSISKLFRHKVQSLFPEARIKQIQCIENRFPADLDAFDCFFIGGSAHSVYEQLDWMIELECIIQKIHQSGKPLIGICFGHQIIAKALGGQVDRSTQGWRIGNIVTPFTTPKTWMKPFVEQPLLAHLHQDQVSLAPPDAELLSHADGCSCCSFLLGTNTLAIQSHPEFSNAFLKQLIEYLQETTQMFDPNNYQQCQNSLSESELNHGDQILSWIKHFIEQAIDTNQPKQ